MNQNERDRMELEALRIFIKGLSKDGIVKATCEGLCELVARNIEKNDADEHVQHLINWAESYMELTSKLNKQLLETERELNALKEEKAKRPTVRYDSRNESRNIMWILRSLCEECKRMGIGLKPYRDMQNKVFASGSYEEALAIIGEKVNLIDISKE